MAVHKTVHMSTPVHRCEVCGQGFAQRSFLRAHALSHKQVGHFRCSACCAVFRRVTDLHKHLQVHLPTWGNPYHLQQPPAAMMSFSNASAMHGLEEGEIRRDYPLPPYSSLPLPYGNPFAGYSPFGPRDGMSIRPDVRAAVTLSGSFQSGCAAKGTETRKGVESQ